MLDVTRLELVHGARRKSQTESSTTERTEGAQIPLFPDDSKPGRVLFLEFPRIKEQDLLDVLENVRPGYVVDLRIAPRFDLGALRRDIVFALFDSVSARYVDVTSELTYGETREDGLLFMDRLLGSSKVDLSRPVVFILGTRESSIATDVEVLQLLGATGKPVSEVVRIPRLA